MKTQTTKNSNASFVLLVILLIGIIIVSSSIGLYAWARYSSSQGGKGLASIAKWHFEVRPGSANGSPQSTFAITRTDGYSHIAEGTLAPGTYGVIPIEIDTTHTEVTMIYEIIIQLVDCPANLKFYGSCTVDGASRVYETELIKTKKTINEQEVDEIIISKYLSLDENADNYVDQIHYENIYWEWPYETPNGDLQDNADQGKAVLISVEVTGTEVLKEPLTLKNSTIKVKDIVNYNLSNGNTIRGVVVNVDSGMVEILPMVTEVIDVYKDEEGKALKVGKVTLGREYYEDDTFRKIDQAVESLRNMSTTIKAAATEGLLQRYGYTGSSRALKIEDVNTLIGYTPNVSNLSKTYTSSAQGVKVFFVDDLLQVTTTGGVTKYAKELEGINIGAQVRIGSQYGADIIDSVTVNCTSGKSSNAYYIYTNLGYSQKEKLKKYFGDTGFAPYLDSLSINLDTNYCTYGARVCGGNGIGTVLLMESTGYTNVNSRSVYPVVRIPTSAYTEQDFETDEWTIQTSLITETSEVESIPQEGVTLADVVKIGDYVNYKASSGTGSYTTADCIEGFSISEDFDSKDFKIKEDANQKVWRVLNVDKNSGEVQLMLADSTEKTVTLGANNGGISAYLNMETELDKIAAIYGNGKGAKENGTRSIRMEDILQHSTYNPEVDYGGEASGGLKVGDTKEYYSGTFIKKEEYNGSSIISGGTELNGIVTADSSNPVTVTETYYYISSDQMLYHIKAKYQDNDQGIDAEKIYNMLVKDSKLEANKSYLIATPCTVLRAGNAPCEVGVCKMDELSGKMVPDCRLYNSFGGGSSTTDSIMPVVTLKANIKTNGRNSLGIWQLVVD